MRALRQSPPRCLGGDSDADRPGSLARTLAGVLAQRSVRIEAVVVHDGPGRRGLAHVERLDDPRVRVPNWNDTGAWRPPATKGSGSQPASGWRSAMTTICGRRRSSATSSRQPRCAGRFAFSSVVASMRESDHCGVSGPRSRGARRCASRRMVIPAGSSNVVVRRAPLLDVGDWDEHLVHLSDWDMWIRLEAKLKAVAVPAIGVAFNTRLGSQ